MNTDFNLLCAEVEKIDADAAKWMREQPESAPGKIGVSDDGMIVRSGFSRTGDLSSCFVFAATPQGRRYWWHIWEKLSAGQRLNDALAACWEVKP